MCVTKSHSNTGNYNFKLSSAATTLESNSSDLRDQYGSYYSITSASTACYEKPASTNETKIIIPDTVTFDSVTYKVTSIADNACKNNAKLTTVKFGKNLTTIGANAFSGDSKLKKVDLSKSSIITIGKKAFYKCSSLKTIKLKVNSLKTIKGSAFKNCNSKAKVTVYAKNNSKYKSAVKKLKKAGLKKAGFKYKKKK